MIDWDPGTVMPSTYSPSALPVKAGRELIFPLSNLLIGRWPMVLKWVSFSPDSLHPEFLRSFPGRASPRSFPFRRRTLSFPADLFRRAKGSRWIRAVHLYLSGVISEMQMIGTSNRPMPALSEVDSNTGPSGCIYLEGGHGAAGVDQNNDTGADQAPGLNIEFIHLGAPGVKTEVI